VALKHRNIKLVALVALIGSAVLPSVRAQSTTVPQVIRVVCNDNYPPYAFRSDTGEIQGIIPDQWKVWSEYTGWPVDFRAMNWVDALKEIAEGKADVLDSAFRTTEREKQLDFLSSYATITVSVFYHKSISGIALTRDLRGFRVGVKAGDASIEMLRQDGIGDLIEYPSYEAIIRAAAAQELRVFCMDEPPALYFLYKYDLDKDFRSALDLYSGQFHRALRKDRTPLPDGSDLYTLVATGFQSIPQEVYKDIERRWFGQSLQTSIDWRMLWGVAIASALIIVILVVNAFMLRARVRQKTMEVLKNARALAASERKNRAFISALPDLFFITDGKGRYIEFITSNPAILYRPAEERLGKTIVETGIDSHISTQFMHAISSIMDGKDFEVIEYDLTVAAGRKHFEARAVPLEEDRVLFIVRDITDKWAAELKVVESLQEKEILLKEIHHRVKNNMQVISSLIQLQSASIQNGYDRAKLDETQQRIRAMAQVHEFLYRSENLSSLNIAEYIRGLYHELASSYWESSRDIRAELDLDPIGINLDIAISLGLLINELVSNSLKYAFVPGRSGHLRISLKEGDDGRKVLIVADDGPGLPEDWEQKSQASLGLTLVRSLAQQLRGELTFSVGPGTKVELVF